MANIYTFTHLSTQNNIQFFSALFYLTYLYNKVQNNKAYALSYNLYNNRYYNSIDIQSTVRNVNFICSLFQKAIVLKNKTLFNFKNFK